MADPRVLNELILRGQSSSSRRQEAMRRRRKEAEEQQKMEDMKKVTEDAGTVAQQKRGKGKGT